MGSTLSGPRRRTAIALIAGIFAVVLLALAAAGADASPASLTPTAAPPASASHAPLHLDARAAAASPGYTPAQLHSAYALPNRGARRQTIAVVSVFDDPYAQADLAGYSKRFGLPACTQADGCFRKLNQQGQASPLPSSSDPTGGQFFTESALGIEVAHGICQSCSITLVEASAADQRDLATAMDAAARAGATVVVTAVTPGENVSDPGYESDVSHPKTAVVAAAGDGTSGFPGYSGSVDFPSALPNVIAVGGTDLSLSRRGGYGGEQAWPGTVSGCSQYEPAPVWQTADAAAVGCRKHRAVADLSSDANPGVLVRVTGTSTPGGPWFQATGTSVSAPIIAGEIGLAGSAGSGEARMLYGRAGSDPGAFRDITKGANLPGCKTSICRAGRGYDGPTGLGTPFGLAAFLPFGGALATSAPRITISAPHNRLSANRRWLIHVGLRNGNPFAVAGSLVVRRTLRVRGRLRLVRFGTAKLELGPLGARTEGVEIVRAERGLLARLRSVRAYVQLRVHGPAGRTVTVTRSFDLVARS